MQGELVMAEELVFDVFYLHKYSHGFSYFNDIVIQLFQKVLVMTMATLHETDGCWVSDSAHTLPLIDTTIYYVRSTQMCL